MSGLWSGWETRKRSQVQVRGSVWGQPKRPLSPAQAVDSAVAPQVIGSEQHEQRPGGASDVLVCEHE